MLMLKSNHYLIILGSTFILWSGINFKLDMWDKENLFYKNLCKRTLLYAKWEEIYMKRKPWFDMTKLKE
jgi:hypothetical protein